MHTSINATNRPVNDERKPTTPNSACIGYRTAEIPGVNWSDKLGRFPTDDAGRIAPALYASGWARRGPSGTIGTNRPDGFAIAEKIAEDIGAGGGKPGRPALAQGLFGEGEIALFGQLHQ